ncbi:MBL fold metallo-hydrolase [Lentzea sp. NPDC005914]|uniref:MBL fold metallo-hydrolase n=1 Tax=Lentzea sp. NPDC005914 TaxID=3154572 RepID=UPI0033C974DE
MGLSLTVLGCATPYPSTDNPCSGYLVSHNDTRLWMDAGTGTLGPLQRHTRLEDVDAIWISHLHADHSADLLTAYYALLYADISRSPIPLFGPPGIADRLAGFLTNGPERSPVESAFEITELQDGHQATIGSMRLTTAAVEHGIPAFAVRIEAGTSLTYSGDTAPCASLTELARDTDVLLCEAESAEKTPDMVHHTPEGAGETAAAAGAGRLIVTHVGRSLSPREAVTRASSRYPGPVDFAAPGRTFTVG